MNELANVSISPRATPRLPPCQPQSSPTPLKSASATGQESQDGQEEWKLCLYVADQTPKSLAAFANLKRICEKHLPGRYEIELVDLAKNPGLANGDEIVAIPTVVRKTPGPTRKSVGDLSDEQSVLEKLEFEFNLHFLPGGFLPGEEI
jgi:circadian clock protein KaiB